MKIWAHTIVKNEDKYVWFSIMSVIYYVDKVLIYDTGSSDKTIHIIREIMRQHPKKIIFREVGEKNVNEFTRVSQQMIMETKADWALILDGDEVWWRESIEEVISLINAQPLETIVSKYYSIAGDIYHYQEDYLGKYNIDNKTGHLNIRAMSLKIPGLNFSKPHGQRGVCDGDGILIQNRSAKLRYHQKEASYLHFTNLKRSTTGDKLVAKRSFKYKHIQGLPFPGDFYYPEVFFINRPGIVPSPWIKRNLVYELKAKIEQPLRAFKNISGLFSKSGY
ncbi:MAG: Glycosyl transferase family 2 [Candidatus Woesebacteria bacterium GW2011_GWB1_38_5b]|uniref:Glycosyl transferase family 2 n=1 Tax=Candidatus Woesebacteria bacterium GW2011_GWB1_38_5b TaxID=1618569 RepID=A0A0G0MPW3_9BACT|nr:MAG: Glycosyl transferase family 2 [Candidatus Woesebacteria bacterium GW2011_GWB1_38_5b]